MLRLGPRDSWLLLFVDCDNQAVARRLSLVPRLRQPRVSDVAVETADVVLMRSDPLDIATAITISRGTKRKMHQNLAWAVGYNSLALPVAAGVFEPLGFVLRRGRRHLDGRVEHHRRAQRRRPEATAAPALRACSGSLCQAAEGPVRMVHRRRHLRRARSAWSTSTASASTLPTARC
jgi:hypothetical protein